MNKERYHNDQEYRRHIIDLVMKYKNSPKGKKSVIKCYKRFRINNPNYSKNT